MIAAQQGQEDIVEKLLEYKPNIKQKDKFGKTACDRASSKKICLMIQSAALSKPQSESKAPEEALVRAQYRPASPKGKKKQPAKESYAMLGEL